MTFLFYQFKLVCHDPRIPFPRPLAGNLVDQRGEGFAGSVEFNCCSLFLVGIPIRGGICGFVPRFGNALPQTLLVRNIPQLLALDSGDTDAMGH